MFHHTGEHDKSLDSLSEIHPAEGRGDMMSERDSESEIEKGTLRARR